MGINRIASLHYQQMDDEKLTIDTARYDYTEPQPDTPSRFNLGLIQSIVIHHIGEECHRADTTGQDVNVDLIHALIHALITVDLGKPLPRDHVEALASDWPYGGIFDTPAARQHFENWVLSVLRKDGFGR